jgi:hypothetical protein
MDGGSLKRKPTKITWHENSQAGHNDDQNECHKQSGTVVRRQQRLARR